MYRIPCYKHTSQILQNFPRQQKQFRRPYTDRKNLSLGSEKLRSVVLLILCICFFFYFGATTPGGGGPSSFTGFLDHTQRRTTVDKTPLDERLARHRDLYLTTHNMLHSQQTDIHAPVEFEPTISASERLQT